ncbi:IgaA/UmoB family intracellular growth attenuator [Eleftheria terrae]|uniref:IgaA/UmoB family intracellular growth attenuator n=1 Tax=Eleftheria terrae TaxID=1597781 RepID=UPI00263A8B6B|nr:IgaA/UmoB family intracellular growth attenuator [Eleftheria terrae]WKB55689.1 intracellular growth attenuator family protein [Eleftheria terrae]
MQGLQLILTLAVIAYSIYSGISYMSRRHGDKNALADLKRQGRVLRTLDPFERDALQPFLTDPLKPSRVLPLLRDDVLQLSGEFLRHGIRTGQGGEVMHNTLGGVDVVLPYDAADHLDSHNLAEVVLTEKFAIVVRLNDTFDLKGGRERAALRQRQDQQWTAGRAGAVADTAPDAAAATPQPAAGDDDNTEEQVRQILGVQLLGQRDETEAEIRARSGPGLGILASLAFVAGFLALGLGSSASDSSMLGVWSGAGLSLLALGAWLASRPVALPAAQKVNRARGSLLLIATAGNAAASPVGSHFFLGDKYPIQLPAHWREHVLSSGADEIELEMRVNDYSAVRYQHALSLDEETRRFPQVWWGRHFTLALVGALSAASLWLFSENLAADFAQAAAGLRGASPRHYDTAAQLAAEAPGFGALLTLDAQVRCDLVAPSGPSLAAPDCARLRWGGTPAQLPALNLAPPVLALYDGSFIDARGNAALDMLAQMQLARMGMESPGAAALLYGRMPSLRMVHSLPALVSRIDAACSAAGQTPPSSCDSLRRNVVEHLSLEGVATEPRQWADLVKLQQEGQLAEAVGITSDSHLADWKSDARDLASELARRQADAALQAALATQRGGVRLTFTPGSTTGIAATAEAAGPVEQWAAYRHNAGTDGLHRLRTGGMVIGQATDANGDLVLTLDTTRNGQHLGPALMRIAGLLAALVLVAWHGPLWWRRRREAARRAEQVQQYCQSRARLIKTPD